MQPTMRISQAGPNAEVGRDDGVWATVEATSQLYAQAQHPSRGKCLA